MFLDLSSSPEMEPFDLLLLSHSTSSGPALPPLPFQTLDGAIVACLSFSLTRPPAVGEGTWGWIPRGWEGLGGPS